MQSFNTGSPDGGTTRPSGRGPINEQVTATDIRILCFKQLSPYRENYHGTETREKSISAERKTKAAN